MLQFRDHLTHSFIKAHERAQMEEQLSLARRELDERTCPGAEYTGWLDLPESLGQDLVQDLLDTAAFIRDRFDILIVVGIGGSYLGARAVIEALSHHFQTLLPREKAGGPLVLFAGQQISPDYLNDLLDVSRGKKVALNVISKSGTTTEPALAFRILRDALYPGFSSRELAERIFVTTDRDRGALRQMAAEWGLPSFEIADDIGGRYSVLTPVGLLPLAVAGLDIRELLEGARLEKERSQKPLEEGWSPADRYAVNRTILARKGYRVEFMAAYEPSMRFMIEWWKQLFGESEGKDGRGLIPAGADFTADLHSLGQLIQEGPRILFETVVRFEKVKRDLILPTDPSDSDQLEYLAGSKMSHINSQAARATALAHAAGGVPNMEIILEERSAPALGRLIYFFQRACALSALMNGVNPFDQPGVEAYKRNMFALLGKPGYEDLKALLEGEEGF